MECQPTFDELYDILFIINCAEENIKRDWL